MHLRKNRIPVQGITNFNHSIPHPRELSSSGSTPLQTYRSRNDNNTFQNKTKKQNLGEKSKTCSVIATQINNNALIQIRKAYKGKSNVWRMAKSWKFPNAGYIDKHQLKYHMQTTMGIKMPQDDVQAIVKKYGTTDGKIDIENFCKIIFGDTTSFSYKPRLFNVLDEKKNRIEKIGNLIDKLDVYQNTFQKKSRHQSQQNILPHQKSSQQSNQFRISQVDCCQNESRNKNEDKQNNFPKMKPKIINSKTESLENMRYTQLNKQQFFRVTQNSFDRLRKSKKSYDFHPSSMANQNQAKTRFRATFSSTSSGFFPQKSHFQATSSISAIQKEEKKQKLEMRLQKLRQTQQIQRSNIQKAQQREAQKQSGRLLRRRLEKQAYQYSSFLKNKWL